MLRNLFICALLLSCAGCVNNRQNYCSRSSQAKQVVSSAILASGNLEFSWQNQLPLKVGEKINQFFVAGDNVYVITDRNYLLCLNRFNGTTRFAKFLAATGLPILGPTEDDGILYFLIGKDLVSLNPVTAELDKKLTFECYPVAQVSMNSDNYYVPCNDKLIRVVSRESKITNYKISSCTDAALASIFVTNSNLFFTTTQGNVFSTSSTEALKIWQFDLGGRIASQLKFSDNSLYLTSLDSNVYKLNAITGDLIWKVPLGDEIKQGVIAADSGLYVSAGKEGIYLLNPEDGTILWQEKSGVKLLAQSNDKSVLLTDNNLLSIMNDKTGKNICRLNIANVRNCATNLIDSRIYVLDGKGSLACFMPEN